MRRTTTVPLVLLAAILTFATAVQAQSLYTGDIGGTVADPSGAVVPGATVDLKSLDTGSSATTTTNASGAYRFSLLKPGHYQVVVTLAGFQKAQLQTSVSVGQMATADVTLAVGENTQTVEVEASAPLINTQPSQTTAFSQQEMQEMPSAGGDITNIAETVPGVVMNTSGAMEGYGNFTANGLPATSNLFTVNGENNMDPYFNINNSGATNLTLGQNEIQEATVITNAYAGEYGQLSGAQVTYVTKSGTNQYHGNAVWDWNGRYLNANNWFNNEFGVARPFDNDNQWAASVGGPIRKDKTFFFVDAEGLRFILPNVYTNTIPTPAFQNAVLANVGALQPSEVPLYTKMFGLYNNAANAGSATPIPNNADCSSLVLPGFNGATQPCAEQFRNSASSLGSEYVVAGRVDQKLGNNDNAYFRYKLDHGTQPSFINPISPAFDAISNQPSYDMQFNETHIFGPSSTNSFMATFSHYVAQFTQNNAAASAAFPDGVVYTGDMAEFTNFNPIYNFPQGRNVTQYQFIDDFTHIVGSHNLKFGVNFRRYDVSDHNFLFNSPAVIFGGGPASGSELSGVNSFANGLALEYLQNDNPVSDVPIALWGIGAYAQDEWKIRPNFTLTLALRLERTSNPVCQYNCFANLVGPYSGLPSVVSSNPASVPYSSDIASGRHSAYMGIDQIDPAPRLGFSWSPRQGNRSTVLSGGFGIFYDNVPESLVDTLLHNPPQSVGIVELGVPPFATGPQGAPAIYAASVAAFNINESFSQISAKFPAGAVFFPPTVSGIEGTLRSPRWEEWNFQLQQQVSNSVVLVLGYAGNHGIHIPYVNNWANAYDAGGLFPGVPGIQQTASANPNYGQVSLIQSGGVSNYNGATVTVRKQFAGWFSGIANYTWSHNLDDVSNGGINPYNLFTGAAQSQINPLSLRANNYGNSDYDIRSNFNAGWVINPNWHFNHGLTKALLGGWQFSGKWFWRSGLPFSVVDNNINGDILNGGPPALYATLTGLNPQSACGHGNTENASGTGNACLNSGSFLNTSAGGPLQWTNQTRNQFHGPNFFDIDAALYKTFSLGEKRNIGVGVQAFNVLNHPNFGIPDNGLGDSTFGLISSMAGTPTSPYGTFLGFDSSPRCVQLSAKLQF